MPITINGSGSLTGLSVGGLPDGSVAVADIAATGTPSSSTFLRGDGSWQAAGGSSGANYTLYTSGNNTWTAPTGVTRVKVTVIGGGGGGGGGAYVGVSVPGYDGGLGGIAVGYVDVTPGTGYAANVGAGGTGGGTNSAGATGGTSSFAGTISATGGSGGSGYSGGTTGANGGASGGNIRATSYPDINFVYYARGIFNGLMNRTGSGQTAQAWSATSTFGAGFGGGSRENSVGFGGISGLVLIEYVG